MARRIALGVAFAATIVVAACSAATVPSADPTSPSPGVAAPSAAPPSPAPAVGAPSVGSPSPAGAATTQQQVVHVLENPLDWTDVLRRLAHVYLGPDVDFPPMPNPPAGFVIRMTVEKVSGNGRWSHE